MDLHAYLIFTGQCREAFETYEKVLGGKIEVMQTHGESPMAGETPVGRQDSIIHARLAVGNAILMGSDSPPEHFEKPQGFSVSINVTRMADAERIFNALAEGGQVRMPFGKTFWAEGFGMLVDRYGIPWMVNCEQPA